jgi:hypothetical protein
MGFCWLHTVYNIEGLSPQSQRYSQNFEHVLLHPDQLVEIGLLLRPRHVGWMAHLFKPHWIVFFYSGGVTLPRRITLCISWV